MTKATEKSATTEMPGVTAPYLDVAAFNSTLISACFKAGQTFLENTLALNQEVMRFASERLEADVQALQDLPRCKNWGETIAVQSDFVRTATEAYLAEMPQMTERATRAGAAMWAAAVETANAMPQGGAKD